MDFSVLSGTIFVNASKVNANEQVLAKRYTSTAVPLKTAIDFRLYFNQHTYLFSGVYFTYMKVNFNVTAQAEDISFKQPMHTAGVNLGIGYSF